MDEDCEITNAVIEFCEPDCSTEKETILIEPRNRQTFQKEISLKSNSMQNLVEHIDFTGIAPFYVILFQIIKFAWFSLVIIVWQRTSARDTKFQVAPANQVSPKDLTGSFWFGLW